MIELFTARSGAPSLRVDGVALHSPYDPAKEASRFVKEAVGEDSPSVLIILGESLGHLVQAASMEFPRAYVLAAVYSSEIAASYAVPGSTVWHPGRDASLAQYLRAHLDELQIEGLRVIEWAPSAKAFPRQSRAAHEAVRQVVQELNGSLVTTVAAGRTWFRNSISNFLFLDRVVSGAACAPGRPIVIAASGPSLEEAAPLLVNVRQRIALWALPSSCPPLLSRGLEPDLVVVTDPGFWALQHLRFTALHCPLAMPLSAARGAWSLRPAPAVFLLEQPFVVERTLLQSAGTEAPRIPPHGTVAATAIDLALSSTSAPVIVTGLDMAARDLLSHARPGEFELLLHLEASRLQPYTSLAFHRSAAQGSAPDPRAPALRVSSALRTYAGWLDTEATGANGRLYRLLPTAIALSGMKALDPGGFDELLKGFPPGSTKARLASTDALPPMAERRRIVSRVVGEWIAETEAAHAALRRPHADLARFPNLLELAHLLTPRTLIDALQKARRGQADSAREAAEKAVFECRYFLENLRARVYRRPDGREHA